MIFCQHLGLSVGAFLKMTFKQYRSHYKTLDPNDASTKLFHFLLTREEDFVRA